MKWRPKRLLAGAVIFLLVAGGAAWWFVCDMQRSLDRPLAMAQPALYEVSAGQTITQIAKLFVAKGWLTHAIYLRLEASRRGVAARVQAGTYEVTPGITPRQL